jgi:predicted membrane chloride channel (bestrophin family)
MPIVPGAQATWSCRWPPSEANDLALDGLCRVCEISVFEALGEPPPKMIPAEKFYFS